MVHNSNLHNIVVPKNAPSGVGHKNSFLESIMMWFPTHIYAALAVVPENAPIGVGFAKFFCDANHGVVHNPSLHSIGCGSRKWAK